MYIKCTLFCCNIFFYFIMNIINYIKKNDILYEYYIYRCHFGTGLMEYGIHNAENQIRKLVVELHGEKGPSDKKTLVNSLLQYKGRCYLEYYGWEVKDYEQFFDNLTKGTGAFEALKKAQEVKNWYSMHTGTWSLFLREYNRRMMVGPLACLKHRIADENSKRHPRNKKEEFFIAKEVFESFAGPCSNCYAKYPCPDTMTPKYATCKSCKLLGEANLTFSQVCLMMGVEMTLLMLAACHKKHEDAECHEESDGELDFHSQGPLPLPAPNPPVACHRAHIQGLTVYEQSFYYDTYCSACGRREASLQREEADLILKEIGFAFEACGMTIPQ
jgi:hypothetical protein